MSATLPFLLKREPEGEIDDQPEALPRSAATFDPSKSIDRVMNVTPSPSLTNNSEEVA
jgi:hypothetical protein